LFATIGNHNNEYLLFPWTGEKREGRSGKSNNIYHFGHLVSDKRIGSVSYITIRGEKEPFYETMLFPTLKLVVAPKKKQRS